MILDEVTFSYRRRQPVLTGVSLEFTPGRTVLLGPNGAGKSTLFSLCCGSQVPSSGWIGLDARHPSSPRELRRRVGLMRQNIRPIAGLSVREQVTYCGWLMGLPLREASSRTDEILAAVDLMPKAQTRCGQLSGGQLRRVGLAQVLIGRPQVLLLDESTAGLDPAQRIRLRTVLHRVPDDNVVVVSTHQVEDLTEDYDRVVVLDAGGVVFDGTPRAFLDLAPEGTPRRADMAYLSLVTDE